MSFDQRPGRLRVVQESSQPDAGRRRGETGAAGNAVPVQLADAPLPSGPALPAGVATAKRRLPLIEIGVFLVACAVGGVVIAVVRPFGLG